MSPILLFTALPLGLFLIVASIATIRRTWTFLVVGDGFLPGKPSLAMLPIGVFLVGIAVDDALLDLPQPAAGLVGLVLTACLALGLLGCFFMPRFLQPRWMRESDDRIRNGTDAFSRKYGPTDGQEGGQQDGAPRDRTPTRTDTPMQDPMQDPTQDRKAP
ncbi:MULTISPECIES: hypothetical protein [unclassified Arthrobacter]|uniref:hypothetical protein n=1 Tax=Arthrobacter sp. N1 TaxID=619291 RepID=UPI003BB01F30